MQVTPNRKYYAKSNPDISMVGLATSSAPVSNSVFIKEKKSWGDSGNVSDSEDVALPKRPENITKSARQAAKATIPQGLSSTEEKNLIIQQAEQEKTKICHTMWFTGRCNTRESCPFEHIRRPRYADENPFTCFGKKAWEKEMQDLTNKYDIPDDRRSPGKGYI